MGFHNGTQLYQLFLSCGLGFLLGLIYDGIHFIRRAITAARAVRSVCDGVFFALSAVLTFFFSLGMTDGVVRWYVLFGVGVGGAAYRRTVGRVWRRILSRCLSLLQRISRGVTAVTRRLTGSMRRRLVCVRKNVKKASFFQKKSCKL